MKQLHISRKRDFHFRKQKSEKPLPEYGKKDRIKTESEEKRIEMQDNGKTDMVKLTEFRKGEISMKVFQYTIKDEVGIHARPAGMLAKEAKQFSSRIVLECGGKTAEATKLMAIMGLGARRGAVITVKTEGPDEEAAAAAMEAFFNDNL